MNFLDTLKTRANEIERPPLIPIGTYTAMVKKVPESGSVSDGKWDTLDFQLQLVSAGEDVDQDDLAKFGGLGGHATVRHRFMFNTEDKAAFDRTLFQLKRFLLDHLKVSGSDDSTLAELINNSVNTSCLVAIKWRADKNDAETQYAEIQRTAPTD